MGVRWGKEIVEAAASLDDLLVPDTVYLVYDVSVRCNMKLPKLLALLHTMSVACVAHSLMAFLAVPMSKLCLWKCQRQTTLCGCPRLARALLVRSLAHSLTRLAD